MIIDSHAHVGEPLSASADALLRIADRLGFDKIMAMHSIALAYDMEEGNRQMAEVVKAHPDRILGYAVITTAWWGDLAAQRLERYVQDYGLVGVKIYTKPVPSLGTEASEPLVSVYEPQLYPAIEKAAELGVPVLAHASPQECEGLAKEVPEATIVMAHMGNTAVTHCDWHRAILAAQRYSNIFLETSSSTVDMGHIEAAVEALGAERVIFGTDMLFLNPHVQLAKITTAELSDEAKRAILGGNMARMLRLEAN